MMTFGSTGNMTKEEIDGIVSILLDLKRRTTSAPSGRPSTSRVNFMASGEVVIESMWSPAVALLGPGLNVRYAAPPSGFRGWCSTHSISKEAEADPSLLQACYDYISWWNSGEPGAIMMRQGYYNAVQETSRQFVEPEEYAFWIDGEAAAKDLPGITGQVGDVKAGQVRDGGPFTDRACNYPPGTRTSRRTSTRSSAGTSSSPPEEWRTRPRRRTRGGGGTGRPSVSAPPASSGLELRALTKIFAGASSPSTT